MSIRSLFATVFFCLPFGVLTSHSALGQLGDEATPQQLSVPNVHHWERTHNESRLPFSFIATESRGLEVVSLHEDQPKMRLSRTDATGRRFIGSVETGDRIVSANGQTLTGVDEFFKVLNRTTGKFPIDVADARSGMILKWQVEPIEVEIPAFPAPANADGTGLLHIVHVIDSKDDSIGDLIELNSGSIRSLFASHVAENRRGEFKLLAGDDCSASNIISTINSLPIRSQDTLLVFVQCHGAYDTNFEVPEPSAGHFFDLQNNDLRRYHVLNAMKARGARLTLLISDCCNRKSIRTRTRSVYETRVAPVDGWSGFEELMFCGVVD